MYPSNAYDKITKVFICWHCKLSYTELPENQGICYSSLQKIMTKLIELHTTFLSYLSFPLINSSKFPICDIQQTGNTK